MNKIKLLHLITNLEVGGAQKVLYDLISALNKRIYEHHIIYFRHGPYVEKFKKLGIPVYHVRGLLTLYDPLFFIHLYRLIKKIQPQAIHALLWAANVSGRAVAWWLRIPIVTVYHNNVYQDGALRAILDTTTQNFFGSTVVAVSDEIKKGLQQRSKKNMKAVEVISNGIDAQKFIQQAEKDKKIKSQLKFFKNKQYADCFIIGSVGRFVPVKNYPLLIESFSIVLQKYDKARLMLVGCGPDEQKLKAYAVEKGVDDKIAFIVGQSAIGYYSFFDCFVQSSDKEGISMALLEAMSLAIACIVTDKDIEHPVIKTNQNGLVVPAGDAQKLAYGFIKIIQNENLRKKCGLAGKQTVLDVFDATLMIKRYHTLFKRLTGSIY